MPHVIGAVDYEFVVRSPDHSVEYVIGTFPVELKLLPGQQGERTLVANLMLADAIHEAGNAVQQIVDRDRTMTEVILEGE